MCPILFKLGPLTLHTYGLMVAVGFLSGYTLARKRFDKFGIPMVAFDPLISVVMLSGILGARIFYFVSMGMSSLKEDPLSFFRVWEGGLVFYGGFIGAAVALFIFSKIKELPLLSLGDAFAAPLLLGQSLGRIGCFAAGCCYGRPTHSILGIVFRNPDSLAPLGIPLHPTQLYSSLGDVLLFLGALHLEKKTDRRGYLSAYYFFGYGLFRFLIEFMRADDRGPFLWNLSPSQWISTLVILFGVGLFIHVKKSNRA